MGGGTLRDATSRVPSGQTHGSGKHRMEVAVAIIPRDPVGIWDFRPLGL